MLREVLDQNCVSGTWYSSARASGVNFQACSFKVVAQIMGHTKVDTTMNVYTQVLDGAARLAADRVGSELFRVVQIPDGTTAPTH
jgi:integrase